MSKKIVLCFDGTWNDPDSRTNVRRLFEAVDTLPGENQVAFYYDGVGTEGPKLKRMVEGAVGDGLVERLRKGYQDLAKAYEPGDEIYIFGFSRGAYTARCLAGLITTMGLPTNLPPGAPDDGPDPLVDAMLDGFESGNAERTRQMFERECLAPAPVQMLGVFDTVAAMGKEARNGGVDKHRYGFLNAEMNDGILHACQALAIDEKRKQFQPMVWKQRKNTPYHTMEQVWFQGAHSDVGGGYADNALSDVPLAWMMDRAQKFGLKFDETLLKKYEEQPAEYATAGRHESWKLLPWGAPIERDVPAGATMSSGVALMQAADPGYKPPNIKANVKYGIAQTTTPAPGTAERQFRDWDAAKTLSQVAYGLKGEVTPATLAYAFNAMQKASAKVRRSGQPIPPGYEEGVDKLTRAFLQSAQTLDYAQMNREVGAYATRPASTGMGFKPAK